VLLITCALPFLGDLFGVRDRALASFVEASVPLRIVSPADASILGDGDLVLIEGTAVDPESGSPARVEIAIDGSDVWSPADQDPTDPTRWHYLWADTSKGFHRIRARSSSAAGSSTEQSIIVQVDDRWSTPFIIDSPYASPGSYRKGQLHMHTTRSFDGWNSMPPADDALEYKRRGYQFVVFTDHDVVSAAPEINDETFIAIQGYESTSEYGHITGPFATQAVAPDVPAQERIDSIVNHGGLAILAHPDWSVGWSEARFRELTGYTAFELFNNVATITSDKQANNATLWRNVLNTKGWSSRVWAVAVDDSHDPSGIDKGWVMVRAPQLTEAAIKRAIEKGAFYASNGPSFGALGVLKNAITASSPDAATIRFFDQEGKQVGQGPASWATYQPSGAERWVRVEATTADGRTAWSQPFWIIPNTPKIAYVPAWGGGMALVGQTIPGARVHVSDRGEYLGSVVASGQGDFTYRSGRLSNQSQSHDFWVLATAPWPDRVESPAALLAYTPPS
jgi:hypothetical protein